MAVDAGSLFYSVDARTEGLLTAERQVNQSTRRMESNLGRAEKATRGFNGSVSDALGPLGNLKTLVGAVASAMAAQRVIAYADAWTSAQNSIRQVTSSQQELTQVTDQLMGVANESRSSFSATSDLYSRLARSTQGLGVSQSRLIRLTETINKGFAASGASAQEAESAIMQLGQGLAAGALRGDEFNSVAEQAPVILRAVAAQTGKTVGELREFAAQGGITADLLIKSLESYADTVESDFSKAVATFGQQATIANNNLTEFIGTSQAVRTAVSSAGSTLVYLSENIDDVAAVASLAATAVGVRLVQALSASIARQAASAVGAASLTAAYSTMGARAATTAVAVRGLSAVMSVVGGPVGVAILAATAIYQFRDSIFGATDPTARLSARVRELTGDIDNLTAAQLDNKIADFGGAIAQLEVQADAARKQVRAAQEQLNDTSLSNSGTLGISGVNITGYAEAQTELGNITSEINAQRAAVEELESRKAGLGNRPSTEGGSTGPSGDELKKIQSEFDRVQQELESQRETIEREYRERNEVIRKATADGSDQQTDLLRRSGEQRKSELQALSDQLVGITANQIERINQQYDQQNREILSITEQGSAEQIEAVTRNEANRQQALDSYRAQELGNLRSHTERVTAEYRKQQGAILRATEEGSTERQAMQQQAADNYSVSYREAQAQELQATLTHQQALQDAELAYQAARIQQMTGFTAEASARLAEFQQNAADPLKYLTDSVTNAFVSLDDTISQTFTNGIRQGESFGDIMANVGRSIVADLLQSLVKLGVQMAINAAVQQSVGAAMSAAAVGQASAVSAAWQPAAIAASIATFGGATATGLAAYSAAMASGAAIGNGLSLSGGRHYGGNVNAGSAYRVTEDGKPEMYTDGTQSYLLPGRNGKVVSNNDMQSGGGGQTVLNVQLIGKGAESAKVNQTRDSAGNQVTQIILADISENGPISRGFKENFNMSRRGN